MGTGTPVSDGEIIEAAKMNLKLETVELSESMYKSPEQTITTAGALTLPHNLGGTPNLFQCSLVCKVAEGGYSIDNEVFIPIMYIDTTSRATSLTADSTNIYIRYANAVYVFVLIDRITGSKFAAINANWRFVVRAWK